MSKEENTLGIINRLIEGIDNYEKQTGRKNTPVYIGRETLVELQQSLQRLEAIDKKRCGANVEKVIIDEFVPSKAIDNANPSEALKCLERIDKEYATIEYEDYNTCYKTINKALIKAQEQEKVIIELCEYCGMDNLYPYDNLEEIKITFKDTFDNYQLQRITSLGRLNKLENENTELKKVLEIIKEKPIRSGIAIKQIKKQIDYSQYKKIILELSEAYLLTEEEFDLLKRYFK